MKKTNPGLRDQLRERFHVADGYYNGVGALQYIEAWLLDIHRRFPDFGFYESALEVMVKKRLPEGAKPGQFDAVVSRFVHDVNPFLRAPYTGESLGEFILEKLMPPYQGAIERLIDDCRDKGVLDSYEAVLDAGRAIVARREKPSSTAVTAYVGSLLDEIDDHLQAPPEPASPSGTATTPLAPGIDPRTLR